MSHESLPPFKVVSAPQIATWLEENPKIIFDLVCRSYLQHADGKTVNPDSYFLRFPDSDKNRIIALPASIESETPVAGIKWVSSFPSNVDKGLDRASAALLINDRVTGYPLACMEGSLISAARTAASAVVGAQYLHPIPGKISSLGIIGAGPIAFGTLTLLSRLGWQIDELNVCDLSEERAALFRTKSETIVGKSKTSDLKTTISESSMILFATSATVPFVSEKEWFAHAPTILHMSLRDLSADIILASQNVADDVDHCLKALTSLHLAKQKSGHSDFVAGGAAELIRGEIKLDPTRPRIFSPFGMGILDLAVAQEILNTISNDNIVLVNNFFPTPYTGQ
ncbi:2,3-diaminopropionate biosynthesis protein SbnB [Pseudomonas tremae]|uniref:2,3-diaminopropionate biosynthesis protein SbnB n=1 Tax=Pseudomonas tremae TaxID=200454 RepID=UPI001F22EE97|nr:2,3-diaminopropionate biosynthesis protein SbnB [Pseudomonas tremae]MCF5715499.1 2,3-diaminopropionate biosynthesis protein SbnB [Pseudomonas tremae]UQB30160.1 2,3-diaminopropionate biosynthesis protein SbnB [Pseudomonas tremae]